MARRRLRSGPHPGHPLSLPLSLHPGLRPVTTGVQKRWNPPTVWVGQKGPPQPRPVLRSQDASHRPPGPQKLQRDCSDHQERPRPLLKLQRSNRESEEQQCQPNAGLQRHGKTDSDTAESADMRQNRPENQFLTFELYKSQPTRPKLQLPLPTSSVPHTGGKAVAPFPRRQSPAALRAEDMHKPSGTGIDTPAPRKQQARPLACRFDIC
mmetsp:Transcript_61083/g.164141  ORF Transcript_61083/g.164141 Transcript_61083/m.164141 type:complete len:209 (-) Transcript_61083:1332-1958(-)